MGVRVVDSLEGGGKYGDEIVEIMDKLKPFAAILIVQDGPKGSGFSVAAQDVRFVQMLPRVLRLVADDIEKQNKAAEQQ